MSPEEQAERLRTIRLNVPDVPAERRNFLGIPDIPYYALQFADQHPDIIVQAGVSIAHFNAAVMYYSQEEITLNNETLYLLTDRKFKLTVGKVISQAILAIKPFLPEDMRNLPDNEFKVKRNPNAPVYVAKLGDVSRDPDVIRRIIETSHLHGTHRRPRFAEVARDMHRRPGFTEMIHRRAREVKRVNILRRENDIVQALTTGGEVMSFSQLQQITQLHASTLRLDLTHLREKGKVALRGINRQKGEKLWTAITDMHIMNTLLFSDAALSVEALTRLISENTVSHREFLQELLDSLVNQQLVEVGESGGGQVYSLSTEQQIRQISRKLLTESGIVGSDGRVLALGRTAVANFLSSNGLAEPTDNFQFRLQGPEIFFVIRNLNELTPAASIYEMVLESLQRFRQRTLVNSLELRSVKSTYIQ